MPNLYTPSLGGMDPQMARVIRDLADRVNYLTTELDMVRGDMPMMTTKAEKENPIPGILTIPYRDHGGQDGFIRINRDGVIQSYVNPVESIFPYVDISTPSNTTTGLDQLHAFTLPANTLARDGDSLWVRYGGVFAANDNDKRIQLEFGIATVHNTGLFDQDSGVWTYDVTYTRVDPTGIKGSLLLIWNSGSRDGAGTTNGNYVFASHFTGITVNNLNTTDQVIRLMAEGTATNDIIQGLSIIDLIKPRTVFGV